MWGGQDSVEPHQLWGNPGQSQNAWNNGGSGHSMNYQPRSQQQWQQNQIHMQQQQQQQQQQWGYQQHQHATQQWQMPPQQMGWSNSPTQGYAGYEEKKMPGNRGYSGYGYGGMQQSMAAQPQAWHGQRDMYQRQQWDNSMRPAQNSWAGNSSSSSSQWQNDWQTMRETENTGSGSPGLNSAAMTFDTWPGVGATGPTEEGNIMWRDPKPKKKIRDTGVQLWGDPTIQTNMDKILRWKEADHEDFQKGPSTSTWNQLLFGLLNISSSPVVEGGNPWADQSDSIWPANIWESSEAVLAEDPESRALHYPEDGIRGFSKVDFVNAGSDDMNGPTVYALQNAYQRAINTGLLPMDMKKHPQDTKFMSLVNTLLQKMVKEEQAETELEHIRQIMARGDYPVTVSQEHERISAERDGFKTEITILSDEIKNNLQGGSWLMQWQKRNTSLSETSDGLTAALQSMGISEETPKMPNPAPWVDGAPLVWNEVAPISINTDLDRPSKLEDGGSGERKGPGPQEFVPGKKWEWTDPAKVAEDPNATPGSVQPSFASPNWGNGNCDPWTEKSEKKSSTEDSLEK